MKNTSDDDDDDFVTIGTALPQYDEDELLVRKPVALKDQTVRDSKGRLRFHGAFTGGFSAGYFNSVDTEEGWTPKTFKSSRSQKTDTVATQRPEDFMDDEDFSEFGIAPKKVATTNSFSDARNDRKRKNEFDQTDSSLFGQNILTDLVIPCRSSVGIRLLRKLGWRDGQGIGPREKKRRLSLPEDPLIVGNADAEADQRVYGCALPPGLRQPSGGGGSDGEGSDSDDGFNGPNEVTFAPHDVCPISFDPKDNVHGLGYRGINPSTEILRGTRMQSLPVTSQKGRRGIRGQAFGVGAFEEDDDDIYGVESLSNYDTEIGEDDKKMQHSTFGWTAPKHRTTDGASYENLMQTKGVIEGFKRSSAALVPKKIYPPPKIPSDFRPFHKFDSAPEAKGKDSLRIKFNSFSRGTLLGERPHLSSVFELVSTEDQAKMEAAKLQSELKQTAIQQIPQAATTSTTTALPGDLPKLPPVPVESSRSVEPRASSGGSGAFVPFARDPLKQKRYEAYLDATKNKRPYIHDEISDGHMTEWEKEREREEFAKAAHLFQPLSNMIASRFTRAKHDDDETNVTLPPEEEKSVQSKAAEMKMFGKLTRDRCAWHPDKMTCRRFNIADPYPESNIVGLRTVKRDKCSIFNFLTFSSDNIDSERKETEPTKEPESRPMKPLAILATVDLRPTPNSQNDAKEKIASSETASTVMQDAVTTGDENHERPPIDLFKAIFEDTDSDADSAEDENLPPATIQEKAAVDDVSDSRKLAQVAPPGGLVLEQNRENESVSAENPAVKADEVFEMLEDLFNDMNSSVPGTSEDVFGPALPPSAPLATTKECSKRSSRESGRRKRSHKTKHRHKKHKSDGKRHKHKKKKLKKSAKEKSLESSGSDADDSDSDSTTELDQKLLTKLKSISHDRKASIGKHK